MTKIVKNCCYGGFSLSEKVYKEIGIPYDGYGYIQNEDIGIESDNRYAYRADKRVIEAVEKLGLEASSGHYAELEIVDIPDDVSWTISEYDGVETIEEEHRSW